MKIITIALALFLALGPILAAPVRAEENGNAGNETLLIIAIVGVVFILAAWNMDFGKDEPITQVEPSTDDIQLVVCQPDGLTSAGVGLRAFF